MVAPHPRRRLAAAAALLLLATLLWAALAWAAPSPRSSGAGALLSLAFLVPILAVLAAAWLAARTRLSAAAALAATLGAYAALGLLYALARRGGQVEGFPLKLLAWPTLLLWQDLCMLGGWPCPAD